MNKRGYRRHHEPVYWWTEDIANARRACISARRHYQRAKGKPELPTLQEEYSTCRRVLKKAIRTSKLSCFMALCDAADNDIWGLAYKVAIKRLKAAKPAPPMEAVTMRAIINTLFAPLQAITMHPPQDNMQIPIGHEVTVQKL